MHRQSAKIMHKITHIRYSICVLNFMLTACRSNLAEVTHNTHQVERAWSREHMVPTFWRNTLYPSTFTVYVNHFPSLTHFNPEDVD